MRDLSPGTQVFEHGKNHPMHVVRHDADGKIWCRYFAADGSGQKSQSFMANDLETYDERNQRGAENDRAAEQEWDRIMGHKRPRPIIYPV